MDVSVRNAVERAQWLASLAETLSDAMSLCLRPPVDEGKLLLLGRIVAAQAEVETLRRARPDPGVCSPWSGFAYTPAGNSPPPPNSTR